MTLKAAELAALLNLLKAAPQTPATTDLISKLEAELKRISPQFYRVWKAGA